MKTDEHKKLQILVVDDEPFMRKLIERMLLDIGYGLVNQAQNGMDALKKLHNQPKLADLIICDLEMPEMNGFEFVENLRKLSDPKLANLPVLILTGYSDQSHIEQAVRLKIHGFLAKPVSRAALESRVSKALSSPAIDPKLFEK
jgi:two-component system chemotaxis response regulator CheY